jgi:hypothetical protein
MRGDDEFVPVRWAACCGLVVVCLSCGFAFAAPDANPAPAAGTHSLPPLALDRVVSLPGTAPQQQLFVKAGHWAAVWIEATAGDADFRGRLAAQFVDDGGRSLPFPPLDFRLRYERSASVPKSTTRGFEQRWYVPVDVDMPTSGRSPARTSALPGAWSRVQLGDGKLGGLSVELKPHLTPLADHQALFVLLADKPAEYGFLSSFDPLTARHQTGAAPSSDAHYRIVSAAEAHRPLLPSTAAAWTTAAYLLWDGYDAAKLSDDQRTALVDWLYWGGSLIVSGPETLDLARLGPSVVPLPATTGGVAELDAAALAPLAAQTLDDVPLSTARRWPGITLTPTPSGRVLLGDVAKPLVVEHRVGRGRVVVTAFRLNQAELVAWPSYGGFFNTHLLRRPPRLWMGEPMRREAVVPVWADRRKLPFAQELRAGTVDAWYDPARVSGVRYLARGDDRPSPPRPTMDVEPAVGPGVAAWRDDDSLAPLVREILREAEGFTILPASAVFALLFFYIFAAVPLNWFLFRTFFRVEWAWVALPVIAIAFTVVVVRAAGLDLGFLRTTAEVTLVEMQPGYDRAHVSRHVGLYNSLGTEYELQSADPSLVALPQAATTDTNARKTTRTFVASPAGEAAGQPSPALGHFVVDSNTVGLLRSEQTTSLGGTIMLQRLEGRRCRLTNRTPLELRDVRIVGEGRAFIERVRPQATVELMLSDDAEPRPGDRAGRGDTIDVDPLWQRFQTIGEDETLRLVAWSPTPVPGLSIAPRITQERNKTVVVVHLQYAEPTPPERETNTRAALERSLGIKPPQP